MKIVREKPFAAVSIIIETQEELSAIRDALGYFAFPTGYSTSSASVGVVRDMFDMIRHI